MAESKRKKAGVKKKEARPSKKKPAPKGKGKRAKPLEKKVKAKPAGKTKAAEKEKRRAKRRPKSKEVKAIAAKVRKKKRVLFRGRFGKRSVRKKSVKKWQKWRKPRGIDIYRQREDGAYPKTGYRTPREIRGMHPSGYNVVLVRNEKELQQLEGKKDCAALFAAQFGKRKRKILIEKAEKIGVEVLNG